MNFFRLFHVRPWRFRTGARRKVGDADVSLVDVSAKYSIIPDDAGPEFAATPAGSVVRGNFSCPEYRSGGFRSEEQLEWAAVCAALDDARERFTMVDLGAGYGRWCVAAAVAARRVRPELEVRLIAVEAERDHFRMMRQQFLDNQVDPSKHILVEAAASVGDGDAWFTQGQSVSWYGQAIIPSPGYGFGDWPEATVEKVKTVSLNTLLRGVDRVDLLDMDIQGAEIDVVRSASTAMDRKVRRVHISTHSPEIDRQIDAILARLGWEHHYSYPIGQKSETPFGVFFFEDGARDGRIRVCPRRGAEGGVTSTSEVENPT